MSELLDLSQQITPEIVEPQIVWEVTARAGGKVLCTYRTATSITVHFQSPLIDTGTLEAIYGFEFLVAKIGWE